MIELGKDIKAWVVGDGNYLTFYFDEEAAKDGARRKDKIYSVRITDWREIQ